MKRKRRRVKEEEEKKKKKKSGGRCAAPRMGRRPRPGEARAPRRVVRIVPGSFFYNT